MHLGQSDIPASAARALLGTDKIIGLSVKTPLELENSARADYVGCGAVFQSATKDSSIIGVAGLGELCEKAALPVVAIGGIDESNVCELKGCKIAGIAVSSAIMSAANPRAASENLRAKCDLFTWRAKI